MLVEDNDCLVWSLRDLIKIVKVYLLLVHKASKTVLLPITVTRKIIARVATSTRARFSSRSISLLSPVVLSSKSLEVLSEEISMLDGLGSYM